jgi:hypothetical protein
MQITEERAKGESMSFDVLGPTSRARYGTTIGLGCLGCELLKPCGGTIDFDCYAKCCGKPSSCTLACPRADNFVIVLQDAGGIDINRILNISHVEDDLPTNVPHIDSGSCRSHFLASPYVALTTFDVISPKATRRFKSPAELRQYFRIAPNAKILLLSIAKDNRLEHYWRFAEERNLPTYLAQLGISHITAPNFSFSLDDPRPEHLVNRSRSLVAAEQLAAAGLSVIPHVNAINKMDFDCWRDFLKNHPHISIVAQEFQTGLASRSRAKWHIWQLRDIEQALGRGLRLIAVAGRRHLPILVGRSSVTVTDSVPFIRTHKRRRLDHSRGRWELHPTPTGEPLDQLLESNVATYMREVEIALAACRTVGSILPTAEAIPVEEPITQAQVSELQLSFWPAATMGAAQGAS